MYLKLRVITGAREEKVEKKEENLWHIWVKEKAEMNMANTRILTLIKNEFPYKKVRLVGGHHSPSKIVSIDDNNI